MANHRFLINSHRDAEQAGRTIILLNRYFNDSDVFLYYDGPPPGAVNGFAHKTYRPYEPHKPKGIIQALGWLLDGCGSQGIVSFIHADMIPTDKEQFYRFIQRFENSGKWLTYSPMLPNHGCIDFCNLHFNLRTMPKAMIEAIVYTKTESPPGIDLDYNEYVLTKCFDEAVPDWMEHVYQMWTMVWPITQTVPPQLVNGVLDGQVKVAAKIAHGRGHNFVWHGFTPESSVIHTNDEEGFWRNPQETCRWT